MEKRIAKPDLKDGAILGFINGLIGLAGWKVLFIAANAFSNFIFLSFFLRTILFYRKF